MAVLNIKRMPRELGRIRLGCKGDRGQPTLLETFRLTSLDQSLIQAAAARYGGQAQPWTGQPGHHEVYTAAAELPCMVPLQELSQWYELWSAGGCLRRCDSVTCTQAKSETIEAVECLCDPENRECKLTTRLSVILHEIPGLGVWRLETHGFYAAAELGGAIEQLACLTRRGSAPSASLAIELRSVKRGGQTHTFSVPVLRIPVPLATLLTGEVIAPPLPPSSGRTEPIPINQEHESRPATAAAVATAPTAAVLLPGSAAPCSSCGAPPGRPHASKCPLRQSPHAPRSAAPCSSCGAPPGMPHASKCQLVHSPTAPAATT